MNHQQLYQGDCLQVMQQIPAQSVDMVLCDLPYGITPNDWDRVLSLDALWEHYHRVTKDHAAIVLFGQGIFSAALMMSNKANYRYTLIWEKDRPTGFLNAKRMPLRCHEDILVFYRKQPTYHPQTWQGLPEHGRARAGDKNTHTYGFFERTYTNEGNTEKLPRSVLHFRKPHPPLHPNEKPLSLCEYLIATYTNPGDLVLDNCMGSGSTIAAAKKLGRRAIGIELNAEYYQRAATRLQQEVLLVAESEECVG